MAKKSSPKSLAQLLDRLVPALRKVQGSGASRGPRIALMSHLDTTGPATMRDLAAALSVSPQAITGLVDALEADGLTCRERHPTDRRKTLIRLNDHATEQVTAARDARIADLAALFEGATKEDRAAFARVAEALIARIEAR
ncbi:MarR family winged helix-turn-helix transcriptional regulator [Jannaschia aquimarina]|uniref:MarR family protein n=1 Tax=Jannaschia aquimarina TaxID=935700 RepID=A0A0D1CKS0_9RHOB|nr:MarR family transcriptional regulator [Jannaschia aquimarina]KIT15377.1 MarR family protein [Jannaschia aquimarina]SNT23186.1 DNA-binding transcriptional regulator, MarR family [Jannaschia aquimarina]